MLITGAFTRQADGAIDPRRLRSARLLLRDARQPGECGRPRAAVAAVDRGAQGRAAAANAELYNLGITFTVYSDAKAIDRILPFDVIPRVLSAAEWRQIESGVIQRVTAINLLLDDLYHGQHVLKDGIVPADLILGNAELPAAKCAASTCRTRPMSTSAAPTSCATKTAPFACSKTMRAPRPGSATSSRTAT